MIAITPMNKFAIELDVAAVFGKVDSPPFTDLPSAFSAFAASFASALVA